LVHKGFSVRQLLQFYDHYHAEGTISKGTTTNEVVKHIVIPETKNPARCYMDSEFMQNRGGGKKKKKKKKKQKNKQ